MAVPTDPDRSTFKNQVQHLDLAYHEAIRYAEEIHPYWLSLRQPRDDALQWALFDYFPAAHYKWARRRSADNIETDGGFDDLHRGEQRTTVYYWLDPQTGAALHHTGVNDEETIPFFPDEGTAWNYLENRAGTGDLEQYNGLALYKARTRKVADAVDVLTDQAGFDNFMPDSEM